MDSVVLEKKLFENLKGFGENKVNTFYVTPEKYRSTVLTLLGYLAMAKAKGIYVSLNLSATTVKEHLKQSGVSTSNLFFIDAVSKSLGLTSPEPDVVYVSRPGALTELSVAIGEAFLHGKFNFIVFDSLSTLLTYEGLDTVERFVHYLAGKARANGIHAYLIAVDDEQTAKLVPLLHQVCDACVKI